MTRRSPSRPDPLPPAAIADRIRNCWRVKVVALAAAAAACASAVAQDTQGAAEQRNSLSIERFVSLTGTYTDNGNLASNGGGSSEFITQASFGLQVLANLPRVRGYLDYELSGIVHANDNDANEIQNALNAFGTAELVDRRAFIDVGAGISQQLVSVFGTRSGDSSLDNANQQEVATFRISPYVQGPLGNWADYEARLSYSGTRSDEGAVSDSTSKLAMLRIVSDEAQYPLSWSLDASRNVTDYSAGRETEDDQLEATVGWALTRDLQVAVIAGREANNYVSLAKEAHDTYGARVSWAPSERASALAQVKRRFFGNSHILNVSYSTSRTSLLLSDTRDVVTAPAQQGIAALGRAYDLFYTQFASIEPDPVLRQLRVLQFLAVYGIDPNRIVLSPFLASAVTLERQQQLSFAWRWVRDTFVLTAARSRSSRLDTVVSPLDDFSQSSVIRQNALTFSVAHRLTPLSSAGLDVNWQKVLGDLQSSTLRSAALTWSAQASSRSSVAASLRHSRFTGIQSSYDETAVSATYSLRF